MVYFLYIFTLYLHASEILCYLPSTWACIDYRVIRLGIVSSCHVKKADEEFHF